MAKQYSVNIDFSVDEQEKLRRFVHTTGAKSVRVFVREAILEKIKNDLAKHPANERILLEKLMKMGEKTSSHSDLV